MSKLVKYPKKYIERFFTRNGNGWALTRGKGITLNIRKPGDNTETVEPIKPEIIPVHLTTNQYTMVSQNGLFTAFRFGDVVLSMLPLSQIATALSENEVLKQQGFIFEQLNDTLKIWVTGQDTTINRFEWQCNQEVSVTEKNGVQVEFMNSAKYDTVEFLATFIKTPDINDGPEEPPPPPEMPPEPEPIRKSLETNEFTILLDSGNQLYEFGFNGLNTNNATLNEIFYTANQTVPNVQAELLNGGNVLKLKSESGATFRDVVISPGGGASVGIQEFADGEVQTYEYPGIIYDTLTLLATVKPKPPAEFNVNIENSNGTLINGQPILLNKTDWKNDLQNQLATNAAYSVSIDNENNIIVRNVQSYHSLPLEARTNIEDPVTINHKIDSNWVSDEVTFKPGNVVDAVLHANIMVDDLVIELPTNMAVFKLGNISLENTTDALVKNVIRTHDRIDYKQLEGNKIAIVNRETEPLRLDNLLIINELPLQPRTGDNAIKFYTNESNVRRSETITHESEIPEIHVMNRMAFNSVTFNKVKVIRHFEVKVNQTIVFDKDVEGTLVDIDALVDELNKNSNVRASKDSDTAIRIENISQEELIVTGKWQHIEDAINEITASEGVPAVVEINGEVPKNFKVTFSAPPVVLPPDEEPKFNEDCHLLVEVKHIGGLGRRLNSNISTGDNNSYWITTDNADIIYNDTTGKVEHSRDVVLMKGKTKAQIDEEVKALVAKYTHGEVDTSPLETGYLIENISNFNEWQVAVTKHCLTEENQTIPDYKTVTKGFYGDDGGIGNDFVNEEGEHYGV